jgi:hypothetical protein
MLEMRQLALAWREILTWNTLEGAPLRAIAAVANRGELLRLTGTSSDQRLSFRHDRVRDWLLSDAAADMDDQGRLSDEVLQDPYFADVIGAIPGIPRPATKST